MAESPAHCPACGRVMPDGVCRECARTACDQLREIRVMAAHLPERMARFGSNFRLGVASRPAETPMPYDQRAARLVRRVAKLYRAVSPQEKWLRAHPEVHPEVARLHHDLMAFLDPRPDRLYLGPCDLDPRPSCPADLYASPEVEHVTCPACGRAIDVIDRRAELMARAMDHIGSLREVMRLLAAYGGAQGVSHDAVRGLVRHGRLASVGHVFVATEGAPRRVAAYRVGDVFDALAQSSRRPRKKAASA